MIKNLLIAVLLIPFLGVSQHKIVAEFTPKQDFNYVIVYRVEPTKNFYVTDSKQDSIGKFNFLLDESQPAGMYKVVYGIPQEQMNFDVIYNGKEDIELTFSLEEGVNFITSEENKLLAAFENQMFTLQQELVSQYQKDPVDKAKVNALFTEMELLQNEFEKQDEYTIAHEFIKANRLYTPKKYEDFNEYLENRKKYFFKHVDYTNPVLQKSSFLEESALGYIRGFVNIEDEEASYEENIDSVAEAMQAVDVDYRKGLLYNIWLSLNESKLFDASRHLADKHLIPAAKEAKDTAMVNNVFKVRNLLIGSKAPDFSWKEEVDGKEKTKWLHKVEDAEQYVLIFWSSGCSHCLAEVPKIHSAVKDIPAEKLQVIAVGLEEEPYQWKNMTMDLPRFIHVLGLGKWENEIGNTYDVTGTPTYMVLNQNKIIVAKPESLKELMRYVVADK